MFCLALLSSANEAGYDVAILGDDSPEQVVARLKRATQAGKFDGVVLGHPRINDPLIDVLRMAYVPFVLAGSHPDRSLCQVRRDDAGVAAGIAERLLARGHRRIGYAGRGANAQVYQYARMRHATLRREAEAAGGVLVELPENGPAAVEMATSQGITAVVAEDDGIAAGILAAAAGVAVPDSLAVASLYGVRSPLPTVPSLASVCADPSDAGREAVRLLAALIDGEPPAEREIVLRSWYVPGGSIGDDTSARSPSTGPVDIPSRRRRTLPTATAR
ncbi:MAG: substrate-binding domain-containing protein [Chloroflexi bacterium]|nr:substrate-binding domain-containing protein [Chloroflexota bacterium]